MKQDGLGQVELVSLSELEIFEENHRILLI